MVGISFEPLFSFANVAARWCRILSKLFYQIINLIGELSFKFQVPEYIHGSSFVHVCMLPYVDNDNTKSSVSRANICSALNNSEKLTVLYVEEDTVHIWYLHYKHITSCNLC